MKTKPRLTLRRALINLVEHSLTGEDEDLPVIQRALKALKMRPVWRKRKWRLTPDRR